MTVSPTYGRDSTDCTRMTSVHPSSRRLPVVIHPFRPSVDPPPCHPARPNAVYPPSALESTTCPLPVQLSPLDTTFPVHSKVPDETRIHPTRPMRISQKSGPVFCDMARVYLPSEEDRPWISTRLVPSTRACLEEDSFRPRSPRSR
jgi:hypothetical protein